MHQSLRTPLETLRSELLGELYGADGPAPELDGRLLRTSEVAALFRVSQRAVTAWAAKGQLPSVRTPGGHHRFPAAVVRSLLGEERGAAAVGERLPDAPASRSA